MSSKQPLAHHTVVEIGHSVAAPYAGLILAELGAEVIKIENPQGGDAARGWGPPFSDGSGPHFKALNRNKQNVAVNLTNPTERDALRDLILRRADAVVCNLRAGVADRHQIGSQALLSAKPTLVYCELSAFGSGGPLSHKPGYDPLMQAFCGLMSITGESAARAPVRVGVSIIDMGAGLWAAVGILAALLERQRTGQGGRVETSLFETALAWVATPIVRHLMGAAPQKPQGSGTAGIVPYQAFRTQDGWLVIGAGNDKLFAALCRVLDMPSLAQDPRFAHNGERVIHQAELLPVIEAFAARHTCASLGTLLDAERIPNAPVQTIAQLLGNAHTEALGLIQDEPGGGTSTVGIPLRFDGQRPDYRHGAAMLGADTVRVLGRVTNCQDCG